MINARISRFISFLTKCMMTSTKTGVRDRRSTNVHPIIKSIHSFEVGERLCKPTPVRITFRKALFISFSGTRLPSHTLRQALESRNEAGRDAICTEVTESTFLSFMHFTGTSKT